jgi:hypothetical protein
MIVGGGGLSAIFSNDIICLAMTPVVARLCLQRGLAPLPFLIGLACAANIGSAATLIGNPQNMLIGSVLQLDFGTYLRQPCRRWPSAWCCSGPGWPGDLARAPRSRRRQRRGRPNRFRRLADRQGPVGGCGADGGVPASPTGRATWPRWSAPACCCSAAGCTRRR